MYIQHLKNSYHVDVVHETGNAYYKLVQFKIFLKHKGSLIDLADGGFVDWTQQLLQNNKQRLLISGVGIELIYKIKNGYL
jgi:isocitrate dehydrogenase